MRWRLALLLILLLVTPASASQWPEYTLTQAIPDSSGVTVDLQGWLVRGDVNWRIGTQGVWYPLSELIFPTNGTQPIITLNWARPNTRYGFRLRFASGGNSGKSTDTDWLGFLIGDPAPTIPSLQTRQPSSGGSRFWGFDLNYRLGGENGATYSAFLGYSSWAYNFRMTDPLTYTICDPAIFICPPLGVPFTAGLNSTYDISFSGLTLGLRGTNRVSDQMTLFGSVSFGAIAASGTGFWNLRDLTFKHQGNGSAMSIEVGMGWTPRENLMVRLGYTYTALSVTGRETFFCIPGGACGDPGLDWDAKSTNQGVTLAVTYQW